MTKQIYDELLARCHAPFKHTELTTNYKGHLYASVQATQARLNRLGVPWDLQHNSLVVERYIKKVQKKEYGKGVNDSSGNPVMLEKQYYDAFCSVQLSIEGLGTRCGTGADDNEDADTATKSALAYALRKAGNQFGIAWYITDKPKEEVELWNHLSDADLTDINDLKQAIKLVAEIEGVTGKEYLDAATPITNGIINVDTLRAVLMEEGRI